MTPLQARELAAALNSAADAAQLGGKAEIDLLHVLTSADDRARRELEASIQDAKEGK